jgi:hypothetical protein
VGTASNLGLTVFPLPNASVNQNFKVALAFINDSCNSTHGNLNINSIFISPSGEWKLGGFEVLSSPKDELAVLYVCSSGYFG